MKKKRINQVGLSEKGIIPYLRLIWQESNIDLF